MTFRLTPRPRLLSSPLSFGIALGLLLAACTAEGAPEASDETSSSGEDGTTAVVGPAPSPSTTGADDTSTTGADATPSTGDMLDGDSSSGSSDEAGFIPQPDAGGPAEPAPLGTECEADRDCASGSCFLFADFGTGVCSECAHDSDCMVDGGPGTCSFLQQPWAACTAGEAGTMCESSEGCAGEQVCAPLFEANPFSFCSECATDEECPEGTACGPTFDVGNVCVSPNTLELHEPCPQSSDVSCISGHCTDAPYMDMTIGLSLCGECGSDDDCDPGQTCAPAYVTDTEISGSSCG